jgi:hypothetical protein
MIGECPQDCMSHTIRNKTIALPTKIAMAAPSCSAFWPIDVLEKSSYTLQKKMNAKNAAYTHNPKSNPTPSG